MLPPSKPSTLRVVVGATAMVAPILHSLTDAMEWYQDGFSPAQLWLNYVAFLPMPWLLLGIYVLQSSDLGALGMVGALLYGIAFTYFAHTTLYAIALTSPDYASLWHDLGLAYTVHGGLMILGGLLFTWAALRSRCLPLVAVWLFGLGLLTNLLLALFPAPDILQTAGTAIRNAGLVIMGHSILFTRHDSAA
jgi:hypothetical protein